MKCGVFMNSLVCVLVLLSLPGCFPRGELSAVELLNVSYDPTREFYQEYNQWFCERWKNETGGLVVVRQSHGGSGKQARAVMEGLEAHVVTLALAYDIDGISRRTGFISKDWQARLPYDSAPYVSTIVFLVRKGNPLHIHDWDDLVRPEVEVIAPNPRTSGGARWNYLAAWGYALKRELGTWDPLHDPAMKDRVQEAESQAFQFVKQLYANVPILDTGARAATTTFIQRQIGDVLITWENEAFLAMNTIPGAQVEIIAPSLSILTEPPVAWVDTIVAKRGTAKEAEAYLRYLYEPEAQRIAARHFFRPRFPEYADRSDLKRFAEIEMFTIDEVFGGWHAAHKKHFAEGGYFDQMFGI